MRSFSALPATGASRRGRVGPTGRRPRARSSARCGTSAGISSTAATSSMMRISTSRRRTGSIAAPMCASTGPPASARVSASIARSASPSSHSRRDATRRSCSTPCHRPLRARRRAAWWSSRSAPWPSTRSSRVVSHEERALLRHILADLRMPGALEALDAILQGVDGGALTAPEAIEQLLSAQIQLRNNRRLQAAMRSSRLPAVKQLRDFDFTFQPSLRREQIESLHELGFVERRENVIFLGPPGVGKTHLAISLAIAAAQSGRRVYYGTLADLITSLEEAQAAGRLHARLKVLTHPALLVVDEIGYLPISRTGAMLFFQLMTRRYEHASTVLTSNKGFEEWGDIFGDDVMAAALIDRLVHHCHLVTIRGNSYRMRQHTELWQTLHAAHEPESAGGRRRRTPVRQEAPTT